MLPAAVKSGLEAGDKLLAAMSDPTKSEKVMPMMAKLALPFVIALGELVYISVDANVSTEVALEAKTLLTDYNARLTTLQDDYLTVRRQIDWSNTKIALSEYENSILALKESLHDILRASSDETDLEAQKDYFTSMFETYYKNAATTLYLSCTRQDLLFTDNLLAAAKKYTRNHRRLTRQFAMGIFQLILEGIELESAFLSFNNFTSNENYIRGYWDQKLTTLQTVIQRMDEQLAASWKQQADIDIVEFEERQEAPPSKLKPFVQGLSKLLNDKYEWRSWLVLAYEPFVGFDGHAHLKCHDTWHYLNRRGRSFVVASVDRAHQRDGTAFHDDVNALLKRSVPTSFPFLVKYRALHVFKSILSNIGGTSEAVCAGKQYSMIGVWWGSIPFYLEAENEHVYNSIHLVKNFMRYPEYRVVLFG